MKAKLFAVIILAIVIVVIGGLSIGGMVTAAGDPVTHIKTFNEGDVKAVIQISGNDVLVTVVEGNMADKITSIYVYYKDLPTSRNRENTYNDVVINKQIVFEGMAKDLTGENYIVVEAVYNDNTTDIIGTIYCDFS